MASAPDTRRSPLRTLAAPFERFLSFQLTASMLLFGATVLALLWANSPWGHTYDHLWHEEVGFEAFDFHFLQPLHLWVNDGLMAIFFFVIGLEIKRELLVGELSEPGKALLPVIAALGGMVVPVAAFLLGNPDPDGGDGWGIPMATDIAFSLGILHLLGKRVPIGLKVFLTAFAIVDDLGAVAVIAFFYNHGLSAEYLGVAGAFLAALYLLGWRGIYNKYVVLTFGLAVWYFFFIGGLHPTLAGVLVAFAIPVTRRIDLSEYLARVGDSLRDLLQPDPKEPPGHFLSHRQIVLLEDIHVRTGEVQSPLQYLEHKLHGYVAWIVMPVFALANAGVHLGGVTAGHGGLVLAIAGSMVLGKFLGISLFTWVPVRAGWVRLPDGMTWRHVLGVALLGGLGFTMALFIAGLAFHDAGVLGSAKQGILLGSLVAGLGGYLILRSAPLPPEPLRAGGGH
jgi:NhaA family Na+:H+ antiporter